MDIETNLTPELFPDSDDGVSEINNNFNKTTERLRRLDTDKELRKKVLPYCRLKKGEIWEDAFGHRVGVLDALDFEDIKKIAPDNKPALIINDPPYNVKVGNANSDNLFKIDHQSYMDFSRKWAKNALKIMKDDSHLYIWLGADYKDDFKPLPDFMIMMRNFKELKAEEFYYSQKSKRIRHPEKLDVDKAGAFALHKRRPRI